MCVDSNEPEDRVDKNLCSSCRTRHRDVKGKKDAKSEAENKQKPKDEKLTPEPLTKYLWDLKESDDGKCRNKQGDIHLSLSSPALTIRTLLRANPERRREALTSISTFSLGNSSSHLSLRAAHSFGYFP